jgi:glycosyltransferase involved in cell wall biosynthesis
MLGCRGVWHIHDGSFEGFVKSQRGLRKAALKASLRLASFVIVLSRETRSRLEPLVSGVRWVAVPNGVPIPDRAERASDGSVRFLFLGNLTRRKGAFDLVAATAAAGRKGFRGSVLLAGGAPDPVQKAELEQLIADKGCQASVHLLGLIGGPVKAEALGSADCLVLPSYAEGLPMAVLEGMSYGLPVIATRIGAIPEAVTDGQEGFLMEPGDVETLADRMARLAADPELRKRMGAAARRRAETEFSLDVMADRVLRVYEESLGRGTLER